METKMRPFILILVALVIGVENLVAQAPPLYPPSQSSGPTNWPYTAITNAPWVTNGNGTYYPTNAYSTNSGTAQLAIQANNATTASTATTANGGWPIAWPYTSITNAPWLTSGTNFVSPTNCEVVFNITNYGAISESINPSFDCSPAWILMENAIVANGGGQAYIPKGTWRFNESLPLLPSGGFVNQILKGDGVISKMDFQVTSFTGPYTNACLSTTNHGVVEIKSINLDNGVNGLNLFYDEQTCLNIHDVSFGGSGTVSNCVILGGQVANNGFGGYPTTIGPSVKMQGCQIGLRLGVFANGIYVHGLDIKASGLAAVVIYGEDTNAPGQYAQYNRFDSDIIEANACQYAFWEDASCHTKYEGMEIDDVPNTPSQHFIAGFYFETNTFMCHENWSFLNFTNMWIDNSFGLSQGPHYVGNDHIEGPQYSGELHGVAYQGIVYSPYTKMLLANLMIPYSLIITPPLAITNVGQFYNSNGALYWVTTAHTNYITGP